MESVCSYVRILLSKENQLSLRTVQVSRTWLSQLDNSLQQLQYYLTRWHASPCRRFPEQRFTFLFRKLCHTPRLRPRQTLHSWLHQSVLIKAEWSDIENKWKLHRKVALYQTSHTWIIRIRKWFWNCTTRRIDIHHGICFLRYEKTRRRSTVTWGIPSNQHSTDIVFNHWHTVTAVPTK
jgi:hypothetical protein